MKLYLLTRKEIEMIGYDENRAFVIRAKSGMDARKMANERSSDEGHIWRNVKEVECRVLKHEGKREIILRDYAAG